MAPGEIVVSFQHVAAIVLALVGAISILWSRTTGAYDKAEKVSETAHKELNDLRKEAEARAERYEARAAKCEQDRDKLIERVLRLEQAGCGVKLCPSRTPIKFND